MTISKRSLDKAYAASLIVWWMNFPRAVLHPWLFPHVEHWLAPKSTTSIASTAAAWSDALWWLLVFALILVFGFYRDRSFKDAVKSIESPRGAGAVIGAFIFWFAIQIFYEMLRSHFLLH